MITATDIYCGGGGTSQAIVSLGITLVAALDHNASAIRSHTLNHPDTLHFQHDAEDFDLDRLPRTDLLTLSPECRRHSLAAVTAIKNERKDAQLSLWTDELPGTFRSRNTMRQVVRFTKTLRPKVVCVENIVQVHKWNGFSEWLQAMHDLGYRSALHCLNAAHFGTPQSRERFYAVFWRKDLPTPGFNLQPLASCPNCHVRKPARQCWRPERTYGYHGKQYDYRCQDCQTIVWPDMPPASSILDLDLPAPTLAERSRNGRPFVSATLARIRRGLDHPRMQDGPFLASYYGQDQFTAISRPIPTIPTRDRHLLVIPTDSRRLDDCQARLLHPRELQRAMGFPDSYQFVGTHAEIVNQIGNAVVVGMMRAIVACTLPSFA